MFLVQQNGVAFKERIANLGVGTLHKSKKALYIKKSDNYCGSEFT